MGEYGVYWGAGEKISVLVGIGGIQGGGGMQHPYIYNTGEKYWYISKYPRFHVIILIVEKRQSVVNIKI